jgi:D-alanyl-lipoteichoic acid acyltransferase DltB (MBOAT superfamily)
VYRKKQTAVKHFGYYALYVMYYPQLVAGPIERPQNLFPQFFTRQPFSSEKLYQGIRLMLWGFFKKLVVADRIGMFADGIFNDPGASNGWSFVLAAVFFTIQIYADFSGYTDIAIGASRCMGIDLMENFRRPYFARNIKAFWQRWHISLTTWFRDYLYIPMGGNRKGTTLRYVFILITFIISGFWHGAAWTFIIWGILHGLYLLFYEQFGQKMQIGKWPAWCITMLAVTIGFVFFRINRLEDLPIFIAKLRHLESFSLSKMISAKGVQFGNLSFIVSIFFISYMFMVERFTFPKLTNLDSKPLIDYCFFVGTLLAIIFFGVFNQSNFIYFQF